MYGGPKDLKKKKTFELSEFEISRIKDKSFLRQTQGDLKMCSK